MASIYNLHNAYMICAEAISKLSYAKKKQVGAVIVKNNHIISEGYNGTPQGFSNDCEEDVNGKLFTRREVLHAESNAIAKLAKSHNSSDESTIYCTYSPCFDCAKLIIQAGIKQVIYLELNDHGDSSYTLNFLSSCGVRTAHLVR